MRLPLVIAAVAAALTIAPAAAAKPRSTSVRTPQGTITTTPMPGTGGERKLLFKYGPVRIHPGQNTISITPTSLRPPRGGWITSFHPNLTYTSGKVPPVDVIHLHHAVWLINRPGDALRPTATRPRTATPAASPAACATRPSCPTAKTWQTPTDLGPGTYTFFCRVHPFMRGSFCVTG